MSTLSDIATHTRASSATYVDANGILQTAAINEPRVGHHIWNGSAWVDEGYFHESEARTNLLLNSDTLATQSVTVAAVPHTLHFTGTGTVTLTGASTAGPLVGTGTGEQNRVSLTFTPTAGTLIVTVTGTVTNADLEVGSTLSSYIPTAGATVTRAADAMTIPAANLPWPEPVVIGPELVTNGTFDTDTDWTKGTGWAIGSGVASKSAGVSSGISAPVSLTSGKVYQVNYSISECVGGIIRPFFVGGTNVSGLSRSANGDFSDILVANTGNTRLEMSANSSFSGSLDNVSVREINPLAVSIQMEGTMTYADTGASLEIRFLRWLLDASNYVILDYATDGGFDRMKFEQNSLGAIDNSQSTSAPYSPGINVPFNISSRHGSTFINGAIDGTALTANLTPTALPYLENTDMQIGSTFNGTIKLFRMWADDLTDEGTSEASA